MLYHYTDRDSARDVLREGVLRAQPVLVHATLVPAGPPTELAPAVWFTPADSCPTLLAKLEAWGWPVEQPGMVWRFAVADEVAPLDLPEWALRHGYRPEAFRWMLLTARMAGEDYADWRLASVDVPRGQWAAVEAWDGQGWRPAPPGQK